MNTTLACSHFVELPVNVGDKMCVIQYDSAQRRVFNIQGAKTKKDYLAVVSALMSTVLNEQECDE